MSNYEIVNTQDHLASMENHATPIARQAIAGASVLASSGQLAADAYDERIPNSPGSSASEAGAVEASCGCEGGGGCSCASANQKPESAPAKQLVYALGTIGVDFGTESRRDSIFQYLLGPKDTFSLDKLIKYLSSPDGTPELERLIWTLNLTGRRSTQFSHTAPSPTQDMPTFCIY